MGWKQALRNTLLLSPVSQVGPLQPGGHVHASGETHRPPLWQWSLQSTRTKPNTHQTPQDRETRSSYRLQTPHWSRIEVRRTRKDRNRSAVPHRRRRSDTATCTELQSAHVNHTDPNVHTSAW